MALTGGNALLIPVEGDARLPSRIISGGMESMLAVGPLALGPIELILVFAIVLILFGAARLSEVGGAIGRSIREFQKETRKSPDEAVQPDRKT